MRITSVQCCARMNIRISQYMRYARIVPSSSALKISATTSFEKSGLSIENWVVVGITTPITPHESQMFQSRLILPCLGRKDEGVQLLLRATPFGEMFGHKLNKTVVVLFLDQVK